MKFMTKTLQQRFAKVGRQENNPDPIIIAKFFNPNSGWGLNEIYLSKKHQPARLFII